MGFIQKYLCGVLVWMDCLVTCCIGVEVVSRERCNVVAGLTIVSDWILKIVDKCRAGMSSPNLSGNTKISCGVMGECAELIAKHPFLRYKNVRIFGFLWFQKPFAWIAAGWIIFFLLKLLICGLISQKRKMLVTDFCVESNDMARKLNFSIVMSIIR